MTLLCARKRFNYYTLIDRLNEKGERKGELPQKFGSFKEKNLGLLNFFLIKKIIKYKNLMNTKKNYESIYFIIILTLT